LLKRHEPQNPLAFMQLPCLGSGKTGSI
jgi:hypothetical protein